MLSAFFCLGETVSPPLGRFRLSSAEPDSVGWASALSKHPSSTLSQNLLLRPLRALAQSLTLKLQAEKAHAGQSGHFKRKGDDDKPVGPVKASPPGRGAWMKIERRQERGWLSELEGETC